jgi:hypothetical protein
MCMFCAAIPAVGALGAKLNVEQEHKIRAGEKVVKKPVIVITGGVIVCLAISSIVYHTTVFNG